MKVAVIGAGALGSLFGGLLAADGHDVWLLHRRESVVEAIEDRGVLVEGTDGQDRRFDARATVDAADVGPADLALVLVKAQHTVQAVESHDACIGPDTRVLSLQNGIINHHRLRDHVGAERTLHGVAYQGAVKEGPGRVRRTGDGPVVFGGPDEDVAERVAEAFQSAGFQATAVDDPFEPIWRKQLTGGAIKPVAALTRLTNRDIVADDGLAELMYGLMEETAAVAAARGIDLEVDGTFEELEAAMAETDHTSSMLQDVLAGRATEIEDVNGAVVEIGEAEGVDVPLNRTVTVLVRGLEQSFERQE